MENWQDWINDVMATGHFVKLLCSLVCVCVYILMSMYMCYLRFLIGVVLLCFFAFHFPPLLGLCGQYTLFVVGL